MGIQVSPWLRTPCDFLPHGGNEFIPIKPLETWIGEKLKWFGEGTRFMGHYCAFCRLSENPDQEIIFENDVVLFLQNKQEQGVLLGSGVIIPVRHAETVFDLMPEEIAATFELLKKVKWWMDTTYHPDGYNVGWNCGAVGGQRDMHAHMHVIPRFRREPYAGCGIRSWLKQPENRWW